MSDLRVLVKETSNLKKKPKKTVETLVRLLWLAVGSGAQAPPLAARPEMSSQASLGSIQELRVKTVHQLGLNESKNESK